MKNEETNLLFLDLPLEGQNCKVLPEGGTMLSHKWKGFILCTLAIWRQVVQVSLERKVSSAHVFVHKFNLSIKLSTKNVRRCITPPPVQWQEGKGHSSEG